MKESIFHHIYKIWLLSLTAELKNFKRVSVHCGMTQSALSQNLKSLETFLGKTLLIRDKGSISLTTDGADLLERFGPILQNISSQYQVASDLQLNNTKLSIGAYDSIAVNILPRFFPQLRQKYPELRLDVQTSRSASLARLVRKGELDMALVTETPEDDSLDVAEIARDHFGLFVSARHEIAAADPEEVIADYGLATISPGPEGYPRYYQRFFSLLPKESTIAITSDSFETVRSVCLSGGVVGIMPMSVALRFSGEFQQLPALDEDPKKLGDHSICLISRKNIDPRLREIILTELTEVLGRFNWRSPMEVSS